MLHSQAPVQPSLTGLCPVQPLDRVKFVPFEQSGLKPTVTGTVFHSLDTSGGNWRVRVVREGESFPHGVSCNVYSHEGTFEVLGQLDTRGQAVA